MDCKQVLEIFTGERGDDLDAAESLSFEAHLDACPPCRERLAEAEDALAPLARWEPPQPSAEAWARVTQVLRTELAATPSAARAAPVLPLRSPRWGLPGLLLLAASLLFAVGVGLLLTADLGPNAGPSDSTSAVMGPVTPPGADDGRTAPVLAVEDVTPGSLAVEVIQMNGGPGFRLELRTLEGGLVCVVIEKDG